MNGYFVTGQDLNEIHSELAGNVCQNGVSVANVDFEHSIRQCIGYDALNLDYVVLCQVINLLGCSLAFDWRGTPDTTASPSGGPISPTILTGSFTALIIIAIAIRRKFFP